MEINTMHRLTQETISLAPSGHNGNVGYGLDPVGNRLSEVSSLEGVSSGSFSFNADDELSSESYDQNGDVIASGGKTFSYDSQGELLSMTSGSTSIGMIYDAFGNRVGKSVNGVVTRYLIDDLNPTGYPQVVEELNGSGAVQRSYTYGLQRISEYQPISGAWTPSFYGYDGGGNVRNLTNSAGTVTDTYEYDAFGNSFTVSGTTPNEMMYRGEQYDSDLGLYYLRSRYYNPATGRFMSRDPEDGDLFGAMSLQRYRYASGDPVNRIDPLGRLDLEVYGIKLAKTLSATVALNAISCGASVGFSLATGGLAESFNEDPWGSTAAVFGCATLKFEPVEGTVAGLVANVTLNGIAGAACAWGLYQAVKDENEYFQDLKEENPEKAEKDLEGTTGAIGSTLVGCEAWLFTLAL
jgi:RHS repeat-associated protein